MLELKRTPLFNIYEEYGARVVDFAGWALPVQFKGIIEEHMSVRENVGLFDVSHMGEILVFGSKAAEFLDYLLANDISTLKRGKVRYAHLCNDNGGIVDDILVYKLDFDQYILVVNASNIQKDYDWIKSHVSDDNIVVENISDVTAQLALQGPKSQAVLSKLTSINLKEMKYYSFETDVLIAGYKCILSRTGYTGEDGFEIYCHPDNAIDLWNKILREGKEYNIQPIGLGARDTLRFEASMPLYGHELSEDISPLEAGLENYVKLDKSDFIGKKSLINQKENGLKRRIIGLEMIDRTGIPRNGFLVYINDNRVGFVTTGSYCPYLKKNMALALVQNDYVYEVGQEIFIEIRNKYAKAKIVDIPFYRR